MSLRIEWRSREEGDDYVLAVDDASNAVVQSWTAEPAVLVDFLNEMRGFTPTDGKDLPAAEREPAAWGDLVMARAEDGAVLSVEPQLYWESIGNWFRSRGSDPHLWRSRH